MRGVRIDRVYSSDLVRAVETARLALNGRDVPFRASAALRELAYGEWEGLTEAEAMKREPALFQLWHRGDPEFAAPGGESFEALMDRAVSFAATVSARHPDDDILVVSHGGMVRALGLALLELPLDLFARFAVSRGSISVLDVYPEGAVLKLWNETSHYRSI